MFFFLLLQAVVLFVLIVQKRHALLTLLGIPLAVFNLAVFMDNLFLQAFLFLIIISFFIPHVGAFLTAYAERHYEYRHTDTRTGFVTTNVRN